MRDVRRMSKKIAIRVVVLLVAALGIFVVWPVVSLFIPREGTAARPSDLRAVGAKAGTRIASTLTNSLIQKFPFDGPIEWKLIFIKDTAVFLSGKVDTNGLHQFVSSHPDTRFIWSGAGIELEEGWPSSNDYPTTRWTNIWFKTAWDFKGCGTSIEGTVDCQSCRVNFRVW